VELIVAIVVGALVGRLAATLTVSNRGSVLPFVLLGVVGAVLGDWVAGILGLAATGTPARWLVAAIGAALVIALVRVLGGLRSPLRPA
jgi:uncharacterized membrane protein YeaQ/YmgE (transglycosylase-associated protein family)